MMTTIRLTFFCLLYFAEGYLGNGRLSISITRHHKGDIFTLQGEKYYKDLCIGLSSGTASATETSDLEENGEGECQCSQQFPVYRDDLNICVNDLQECRLLPFVSGATAKKIPYVFLPLKGQIVYPSAELVVSENGGATVCVVSGGQFLGRNGWLNLRNNSDTEPPFRLFRDEGRTYLQWFGETSMRMAMEGRIILVHLMCKDANAAEEPKIFTPCIAFRVAGNPSVREVMFATDVHLAEEYSSGGLSKREYVAIGLCSLFLAVVYVASIFLYLHWRKQKKRKTNMKIEGDAQLTIGEEGIVKNNPLLQGNRHLAVCGEDNAGYITDSNSCCSDSEQISDLLRLDEDDISIHQNVQTSAIVHPCHAGYTETTINQDSNNIERLPEENVSIVETLETKEAHPETIKAISSGNNRRKLYFNPSYFEPELLKAPPPAALEFLIKIREVIAIAKHKMSNKKFSPSLLGIPEEEVGFKSERNRTLNDFSGTSEDAGDREATNAALIKSETSHFHLGTSEFYCPSDVKQKIIQKWLEDVPVILKNNQDSNSMTVTEKDKTLSDSDVGSDSGTRLNRTVNATKSMEEVEVLVRQERKRPSTKARAPTLSSERATSKQASNKTMKECYAKSGIRSSFILSSKSVDSPEHPPGPPPLPPVNTEQESEIADKGRIHSNTAKNLMDAVIQELADFKRCETPLKSKDVTRKNQQTCVALNEAKDEKILNESANERLNSENKQTISREKTISEFDIVKGQSGEEKFMAMQKTVPDEHEYETIILNPDKEQPRNEKSLVPKGTCTAPEIFLKCERSEGYSLVSEVYVNDGYASSPESISNCSNENDKISFEVMNEKTSRLTIHVKDSSKQNKDTNESDNFEPDTLERKERKTKSVEKEVAGKDNGGGDNDDDSHQRFYDLDYSEKCEPTENNEHFTDSLERPTILLKTNGSFKRNSHEKDVNELFRNLSWARMENFGSLREIYEAKNRSHRKRTETSSLVDIVNNSDNDCISTLSWCEERRNKLLHRGIILHIDDELSGRRKGRFQQNKSTKNSCVPEKMTVKSKSVARLRSGSPELTTSMAVSPFLNVMSGVPSSPVTSPPPPLPPPRSLTVSPHPHQTSRSTTSSPVHSSEGSRSACATPPPPFVGSSGTVNGHNNNNNNNDDNNNNNNKNDSNSNSSSSSSSSNNNNNNNINNNNTVVRVYSKSEDETEYHSVSSNFITSSLKAPLTTSVAVAPPRPPKTSLNHSPPLPPRNSKPPLPPKSIHARHKSDVGKFATRPLPPLPCHTPCKELFSPTASYKDLETMSSVSGASMDSLNSSEYESFYTMPYEDDCAKECTSLVKNFMQNSRNSICNKNLKAKSTCPRLNKLSEEKFKVASKQNNESMSEVEKQLLRNKNRAFPHRLDDSGYLSTDSSETYCPRVVLPSHIPRIPEKAESSGGQNSETEESICDGASESGAESTATDSFFYGDFKKSETVEVPKESLSSQGYFQISLRLSDVEVNSDTERHCVPILVRP